MSRFVLVHGAWHGAWCWDKIVPLLEQKGHEVVIFDLPGHGDDPMRTNDVSLQAYTDRVVEALDASPDKSIIVGHSMGGLPAGEAAESRPEKVEKLVFLTAFMLRDSQTLLEVATPESGKVIPNLEFAEDQASAKVKDDMIVETFYGDCSEEDIATAKRKLVWQAAAPFATPVQVTVATQDIPKVYIECTDDQAIFIQTQRGMQAGYDGVDVISMNTSHSPFFSAPEELAANLDAVSR